MALVQVFQQETPKNNYLSKNKKKKQKKKKLVRETSRIYMSSYLQLYE